MGCIMCPSLGRRCVIIGLLAAGTSWKVLGPLSQLLRWVKRALGVRVWTTEPTDTAHTVSQSSHLSHIAVHTRDMIEDFKGRIWWNIHNLPLKWEGSCFHLLLYNGIQLDSAPIFNDGVTESCHSQGNCIIVVSKLVSWSKYSVKSKI